MSGRPRQSLAPIVNRRRGAPEKAQERAAHRLADALGFQVYRLSQSRASRQSPGWPDLLLVCPAKGLAVWFEAKSPTGKQSPAQQAFQANVTACGHEYVVGTVDALVEWTRARGLIR